MCDSCSCSPTDQIVTIHKHGVEHSELHAHHAGSAGHDKFEAKGRKVEIGQEVLARNDSLAAQNRELFALKRILALNLVSSPGSGKTTLLEYTLRNFKEFPVSVIEGDQQTARDAQRIADTGVPVVQVNTGAGCHLDAAMVSRAVHKLEPGDDSILFIENVGNLVCPALFDLGEAAKVVVISVTEGEDKPEKYPYMFKAARLCLINKIDLLPYVDFDPVRCRENALRVNPDLVFFELSATKGDGMDEWLDWLRHQHRSLD
ncbi:MAG: hydrogenase nickel incorporation protein HypB [Proteobacteria bacterium]|nr:hydrogenase nickel incorporation protein HypB [Pseudomonadota bacterium]MBU1717041.1 hydrogenase nickel incorporation protein HypB [Pseudomonadota bacterium]